MDVVFSSGAGDGLVIGFLWRNNLLAANLAFRAFPINRHEKPKHSCAYFCLLSSLWSLSPLFSVNLREILPNIRFMLLTWISKQQDLNVSQSITDMQW